MDAASRRILLFSVVFACGMILPGTFTSPFPLFPLMQWADFLDMFTPLYVVAAYWYLFDLGAKRPMRGELIAFGVFSGMWVSGHGMHLSSNAVSHLLTDTTTDAYRLNYLFDENLSHHLWSLGSVGMTLILTRRQWRNPAPVPHTFFWIRLASVVYGFTYFCVTVEGQLAWLLIPNGILILVIGWYHRAKFPFLPILAFFFMAHLLGLGIIALWASYWGGLPEFSNVGLID